VRAAHAAFVLALLGYSDVCMYDGSMGEWANRDDTPLE
jgi:3-mercaptopyruvate sulfurtransferase SseA